MYELDLQLMSDVIRDVFESYDIDVIKNDYRFRAAIMDCMGANISSLEGQLLIISSAIGLGTLFLELKGDKHNWEFQIDGIKKIMIEDYGFNTHRVNEMIYIYATAFGLLEYRVETGNENRRDLLQSELSNNISELVPYLFRSNHSYGIRYIEDYEVHRDRKRTKIWNMILKGDNVPTSSVSLSRKVFDGVTETTFFIYESDCINKTYEPEEGRLIGMIRLSDIKDSKSGDETKLTMSIDEYGFMKLQVQDMVSGRLCKKTIKL